MDTILANLKAALVILGAAFIAVELAFWLWIQFEERFYHPDSSDRYWHPRIRSLERERRRERGE